MLKQKYLFGILVIFLFLSPTLQDYCDDNCAKCVSDTVCGECEEELQRELVDGKCVCEDGFFVNPRGLCESKNQTANYILLVFVILFIIAFFSYIFNVHKSNPLRFCSLLQLKHYPIPVPQHEFNKAIYPINMNLQNETSQNINITNQFETTNKSLIPRDYEDEKGQKFRIVKDSHGLGNTPMKAQDLDDINTNSNTVQIERQITNIKQNSDIIGDDDGYNYPSNSAQQKIKFDSKNQNQKSDQFYQMHSTQFSSQQPQQQMQQKQQNKNHDNYQPDSFRARESKFEVKNDDDNAVSIHSDWDDDEDDEQGNQNNNNFQSTTLRPDASSNQLVGQENQKYNNYIKN